MRITIQEQKIKGGEVVIMPLFENFKTKELEKELNKEIIMFLEKQKQKGIFKGEKLTTTTYNNEKNNYLFIGLGNKKEKNPDLLRKASALGVKHAKKNKTKKYFFKTSEEIITNPYELQAIIEGAMLGKYDYDQYKNKKEITKEPEEMIITTKTTNNEIIKQANKIIKKAMIISESVNLVRNMVNEPASNKPPKKVVEQAKKLGKKHGFKVTSLGKKQLQKLGMNAMLAVNRASNNEPQLCILELNPDKKEKPVVIIGKGVTFDAGGLQIKPDEYMLEMKSDMAGAATVLGVITALSRMKYNKRVIGIMGLVENLIGPEAYKPNDIIKAYNGKTIEVMHTDAEGRLVLADAISFAEKNYNPKAIIDFATLTGACLMALGYRVAGLMGNNEELIKKLKESSEKTDELLWQLPLYNHYKKMMKGTITDLRNIHKSPGKYGPGAITAAAFLNEFVTEKTPWAHLDIAGTAFSKEKTEYVPEGGTGWGVRLMIDFFNNN